MNESNPALQASRRSWHCVQNHLKEEWLALMAEDVVIEDPIGVSPLDPEGQGHRGVAAAATFWDRNIGPNQIEVEVHDSYTGGDEVAHLMTLKTSFPHGGVAEVKGIFTYAVNDAGKIVALRGYWEMSDIRLRAG
ncbi:MAG: steroid delta-isomerase [Myxococcales bacterium]|nr:steroid delta-isomerase [Myxococcales bacterium]